MNLINILIPIKIDNENKIYKSMTYHNYQTDNMMVTINNKLQIEGT